MQDSDTSKRKRDSSQTSPDQWEFKRLRDYLSSSSSLSSPEPQGNETQETSPGVKENMNNQIIVDELKKYIDDKLSENRRVILSELEKTFIRRLEESEKRVQVAERKISQLEKKNDTLEEMVDTLKTENVKLRESIDRHDDHFMDVQARLVEQEQYSRKNNIRIIGVPEQTNEKCREVVASLLNKKLKLRVETAAVGAAHRLPAKGDRVRPIIVRFLDSDLKQAVMEKRKALKGSKIVIQEDLCLDMQRLLNRMKNNPSVKDAWAWNGKIFAKGECGTVIRIRYGQSTENLFSKNTATRAGKVPS